MSLSKLSIWVRDTAHPCLPYQSTSHSWIAIIWSCGMQPLSFGVVNNGIFPLTEKGKAGGMIHGQVKVPPGCYIVVALATCKNIFTDMAYVQVGNDETVTVNLITKRLSTCTGQLLTALNIASILGPHYSPGSPPGKPIPREVIAKATKTLKELQEFSGWDPVMDALPITVEEIKKMALKEARGQQDTKEKK